MSDYDWPASVIPATDALAWLDNTVVFRSPLSGTTRTESRPGGRWHLSLTVTGLMHEGAADSKLKLIEAYLFKLNGAEHRAVISDPAYVRSGPAGGSPVVNGANQTGLTLETSGWTGSTTVLYAGDRIGVSGQMIPLTTDATTDGGGIVTLQLAHPIRTAVTSGTAIEVTAPTARFILTNKAAFAAKPGIIKTVLAEFEEAIA